MRSKLNKVDCENAV